MQQMRSKPYVVSLINLATVAREQPVREAKTPAASNDRANSSVHRAISPLRTPRNRAAP